MAELRDCFSGWTGKLFPIMVLITSLYRANKYNGKRKKPKGKARGICKYLVNYLSIY